MISKQEYLGKRGNQLNISEARADEIWSPFVECGRVEPFEGAKSLFPGDSSSIDVEFPIPRRVEPSDNPELLHDELKSTVRLGVTRVSSKEECLPCRSTIALIRGSGTVSYTHLTLPTT